MRSRNNNPPLFADRKPTFCITIFVSPQLLRNSPWIHPAQADSALGGGTRVTAVTAWGKRPVPYRTRKLRPTAPMVLHSGGCGRVGHRRTPCPGTPKPLVWGFRCLTTHPTPEHRGTRPAEGDGAPCSRPATGHRAPRPHPKGPGTRGVRHGSAEVIHKFCGNFGGLGCRCEVHRWSKRRE